jgi:beta-glucosidase
MNKATNNLISKFPRRNPNIHYTDIGHIFLNIQGNVKQDLMPDSLHPNPEGHLLMFEALDEDIIRMMVE